MENLTGKRFGKQVVLSFSHRKGWNYYWNCQCDCGHVHTSLSGNLKRHNGRCVKCARVTHGHSIGNDSGRKDGRTLTYSSWLGMHSRVRGKSEKLVYIYKSRGIKVCDRWSSYENFLADMGERPGKEFTLDRINNDLGYYPENCRWADWSTQLKNRRKPRKKLDPKGDGEK